MNMVWAAMEAVTMTTAANAKRMWMMLFVSKLCQLKAPKRTNIRNQIEIHIVARAIQRLMKSFTNVIRF